MQQRNMSVICPKWMCFVLFPLAKPTDQFSLWSQLLPESTVANATITEDSEDFIFQQDGAPPHFHFNVRAHLNANLPSRWIGRTSHNESPLLPWPRRSPDLNCNFFLWVYIKDRVYVRPTPRDLPQLWQRIVEAVTAINHQMLQHAQQELDYRIDICRITKGGHIEHL